MTSMKNSATTTRGPQGFTAEERAAMKERAQELRVGRRWGRSDGASAVLAKIAKMPPSDRAIAERLHALVTAEAPSLVPKLWYGMPAYERDGKIVCFFQGSKKFKTRYATVGFNDSAQLDDGDMWPTAFALPKLTPENEVRLAGILRKAVG